MNMNINTRARSVARIFDILAWVVLVVGTLFAAITLIAGLATAGQDGQLLAAMLVTIGIAVYTALIWASITLGTVIAGYIAERTAVVREREYAV